MHQTLYMGLHFHNVFNVRFKSDICIFRYKLPPVLYQCKQGESPVHDYGHIKNKWLISIKGDYFFKYKIDQDGQFLPLLLTNQHP